MRDVVEVAEEHHRRLDRCRRRTARRSWPRRAPRSSPRTAASTSRWRPNAFTIAWPVNASSTCALSMPVCRHCAMNRARERFAICFTVSSDSGIVTSATSASSGEMIEHHHQHADERQHRREQLAQRLLQALGDVVDVVGDAAEQVAARLAVDVAERHRLSLSSTSRAQPVHRALHDAGEQERLQVQQRRRTRRRARGRRAARGAARRSRCPRRCAARRR